VSAKISSQIIRFSTFEVNLHTGELRQRGQKVKLQEQPLQVLSALLERPGELVTREELRNKLWSADTFVDFDHSLNAAIKRLRDALGESAEAPIFIETLARRGYRFIAPVNGDSVSVQAPGPSSKLRGWAILAMIGLVFVGAAAWLIRRTIPNPESTLTAVPLTAFSGSAVWSSFSPDGQQVTFAWDKNLGWRSSELFVQSVGGLGPPLQLTHTAAPAFLSSAVTAWTPDGRWIAYERYNPKPGQRPIQIVLTPAPAGGPEVVVQRINSAECGLSWSPDGRYLAFIDRDLQQEPYAIFLLQRDTLERRRLTSPPKGMFGGDRNPAFSHDGKRIAFVRNLNGATQVAVLTLASGSIQMLASGPGTINSLAWAPSDRGIIYGSHVAGFSRLWRVSSTGGDSRPLDIGEDGWAPAVSERAHRLAYGRGTSDSNIWRIRLGKDKVETRSPLIASSRQDSQPEFSPDETKIVLTSDRSGPREIWVTESDGSNPIQITKLENSATGEPRWSPDGTKIAFDSRVRGKSDIYLVGLDGAEPRRLTDDLFDDSVPSWSADGRWIYYGSDRSGELEVWKVSAMGGSPAIQVTKHGGLLAFETPDGKNLYYISANKTSDLWQINMPDGVEHRVADAPDIPEYMSCQITNDGMYFTMPDSSSSEMHSSLRYFSFVTRKIRTVTSLGNLTWTQGLSVSRDGRTILYAQQDHFNMNIMLVDNFH